jgi:hypothetical protein
MGVKVLLVKIRELVLSDEHKDSIAYYVPAFEQYIDSFEHNTAMAQRRTRTELYAHWLSPEGLQHLTETEFGQIVSTLWASRMWSNTSYYVERLIRDNKLPRLTEQLNALLWGEEPLAVRYEAFRKNTKGFGAASITELLAFIHPNECGSWNERARKALDLLGCGTILPTLRKSQITGTEYVAFNELLGLIRDELARHGLRWLDVLDVNYFLNDVWRVSREKLEPEKETAWVSSPAVSDFDHNEVQDQLVAIGQWLGFVAEKEKKVARGAVVDVIWQAKIANLGAVTYVFEVQRRGSIDSLILNLQRATANPTVQRAIVVANHVDLDAVRREVSALPEGFRTTISYMEVSEIVRAARLIEELSGIIGKLDLVRSEFNLDL